MSTNELNDDPFAKDLNPNKLHQDMSREFDICHTLCQYLYYPYEYDHYQLNKLD